MAGARKAFPLRLDPAVWAAIERLAGCELRSANAQVECLLREAMKARGVRLDDAMTVKRGRPAKTVSIKGDRK